MKKLITTILLLMLGYFGFTQTFTGIRHGLYRGELDAYQRGEVDVYIDISENQDYIDFKTKPDQTPSIFTISTIEEGYVTIRGGSSSGIYFVKDNQFIFWTSRTISGYGINYSLLKERVKKIYSCQQLELDLQTTARLVYEVK